MPEHVVVVEVGEQGVARSGLPAVTSGAFEVVAQRAQAGAHVEDERRLTATSTSTQEVLPP